MKSRRIEHREIPISAFFFLFAVMFSSMDHFEGFVVIGIEVFQTMVIDQGYKMALMRNVSISPNYYKKCTK